jgi:hypothetical protein
MASRGPSANCDDRGEAGKAPSGTKKRSEQPLDKPEKEREDEHNDYAAQSFRLPWPGVDAFQGCALAPQRRQHVMDRAGGCELVGRGAMIQLGSGDKVYRIRNAPAIQGVVQEKQNDSSQAGEGVDGRRGQRQAIHPVDEPIEPTRRLRAYGLGRDARILAHESLTSSCSVRLT